MNYLIFTLVLCVSLVVVTALPKSYRGLGEYDGEDRAGADKKLLVGNWGRGIQQSDASAPAPFNVGSWGKRALYQKKRGEISVRDQITTDMKQGPGPRFPGTWGRK